jgi:dihydrofolate reductase
MVRLGMIVAATSRTMGIGVNGMIPWYYPEDLARFKKITQHSTILMGRTTWESLPKKPLPNRFNIVISSTKSLDVNTNENENPHLICSSPEDAIKYCQESGIPFAWVIGGESIYRYFINHPLLDVIELTLIPEHATDNVYKCDRFFPKIPLTFTDLCLQSAPHPSPLQYATYRRPEFENHVISCDGVPLCDS